MFFYIGNLLENKFQDAILIFNILLKSEMKYKEI